MEAIAVVKAAGVAVHAILRPTPLSRVEQHGSTNVLWIRPEVMLHELTAKTGGTLVTTDVLSAHGLRDVFAQMLSESRAAGRLQGRQRQSGQHRDHRPSGASRRARADSRGLGVGVAAYGLVESRPADPIDRSARPDRIMNQNSTTPGRAIAVVSR